MSGTVFQMNYLCCGHRLLIDVHGAGSGLQVPGSNFMSVLARLVEATTTLESNVEGVTDSANDITSASFRLLRCVLQHCSAPSEGVAEKPFTQQESVCLFVNLIKVR